MASMGFMRPVLSMLIPSFWFFIATFTPSPMPFMK